MDQILHHQEAGTGDRVVVMLHGLLGLGSNLGAVARALADGARVLLPDLRNHGRSFRAPGMSYPEMAADVARWLDALGIARASLLGHSMGGKLAMQFALDHPARCERLLVADIAPVAYAGHHEAVFRALARVAERPDADRRQTAALLGEDLGEQPALVSLLLMHRFREADGHWAWRLGLREIEQGYADILAPPRGQPWPGPVLFVRGERSDYVLPAHAAATQALFPAARLKTVGGAGHWLHAEKPAVFARIARDFLLASRCQRAAGAIS